MMNLSHLGRRSVILAVVMVVAACRGGASQPSAPASGLIPTLTPVPELSATVSPGEASDDLNTQVTARPVWQAQEGAPSRSLFQRNDSAWAERGNRSHSPIVIETDPPPPAEMDPLFIESLRRHRDDPLPTIETVALLVEDEHFTRYQIAYTSDGLRITGVMNVPTGEIPERGFPVILLNHGYYSPASYTPGTGTQREADYLVHHGYVTIASDYRGYADSEGNFGGHFDPGWTYDILDLLDALPSLDVIDPERVGMWGHSTGGEIALRVITARDAVDATVLFGSMGADAADNFRLVQKWDSEHTVVKRYGTPEEAPEVWAKLSPINYLADVSGPISIHHGEFDTEVPLELSTRLWEAMQAAGVPGEYYTYPDQHHVFRGVAWEQAMERVLAFFDRYVKNQ